ncbi:unnamed protein product, partial [Bubo scandiacus]
APGEERRGIVRSSGLKRGAGREKGALGKGDVPVTGAAVAQDRCRHLWCPGRRCAG